MEQITKQLSLVDFLGIALPGAILVLSANYYIGDITAPCVRFFGQNAAILSTYFVVLSYLCGCALHQLGICLEARLLPNEENVFASHCQQEAIREAYRQQFNAPFPDDPAAQIKAGREILHHVQYKDRSQRIVIFSAFYAMSRTLLAAIPLFYITTLFKTVPPPATLLNIVSPPMALLCISAWGICFIRWRTFDQCCISEAYTIFAATFTAQRRSVP